MASVISVAAGNHPGYDITIESGLLPQVGRRARPLTKATRVCVVSDSNVARFILQR